MRIRMIAAAGLVAAALPAAAHAERYYGDRGYSNHSGACDEVRGRRAAAGAVIGGILGGLTGNAAAADGVRAEGTALGAAVGAALGAGVGGSSLECDEYSSYGGYQTAGYGYDGYGDDWGVRPVAGSPHHGYPRGKHKGRYGQGHSSTHEYTEYGYEPRYRPERPAARECETVYQITRLPDGKEIHEPVRACREAYYGDWDVD